MNKRKLSVTLLASALILFAAGCKKKAPAPPPPPPPPPVVAKPEPPKPSRPTATLTAEPSSVQRGQAVTLRWNVSDADSISVEPGVGNVPASGSREMFPNESTTYTLSAKGPGGDVTASARVNVTAPPPPPAKTPAPKAVRKTFSQRVTEEIQDVYFNYDKYDVREDARSVLTRNADALKAIMTEYSGEVVTLEGHCDERGSAAYNLGLGDRRSSSTKDFLVQLGVPADRLRTVSYGKERPQCQDATEECYQKNRRAHFAGQ